MNNTFLVDIKHSKQSRPAIDNIYKSTWPRYDTIKRSDGKLDIDRYYHVDAILESSTLALPKIIIQEKALRAKYSNYNTLTMEYMQDRHEGIKGEFFNLCAQYYFSGYINDFYDGFIKYIIINIPEFMRQYSDVKIPFDIKSTDHSNASFICFKYSSIPLEAILKIKLD
jgi:hypothetical protein